jgi:hypothetical protein
MTASSHYERPDWHTDESWAIETLDWRNRPEDFDTLVRYVTEQIEQELAQRHQSLFSIVRPDELRSQVKAAAETYEERHRRIGLAIHATLRARAYVATRMKGERWDE